MGTSGLSKGRRAIRENDLFFSNYSSVPFAPRSLVSAGLPQESCLLFLTLKNTFRMLNVYSEKKTKSGNLTTGTVLSSNF